MSLDTLRSDSSGLRRDIQKIQGRIDSLRSSYTKENIGKTRVTVATYDLRENDVPWAGSILEVPKGDTVAVVDVSENYAFVRYRGEEGWINQGAFNSKVSSASSPIRDKVLAAESNLESKTQRLDKLESKLESRLRRKRKELSLLTRFGDRASDTMIQSALNNSVMVGMPRGLAMEAKGYPDDINRSEYEHTVREQWVYRDGSSTTYVYVVDGVVESIQYR